MSIKQVLIFDEIILSETYENQTYMVIITILKQKLNDK